MTGTPIPGDHRSIELPAGATIEVRPTIAADGSLIGELYDSMSNRDLYRRFFTAHRPDDAWCLSWAAIAERGGFGVIALLHDALDSDEQAVGVRPIGEAGYALRSDGDGDLAVTVAADRRGWLGGYLLDVLIGHAHSVGIANLQADVLLENRAMLALLRHHGAVDLAHDDAAVRVTISTDGPVPSWPPLDERPRVLVELDSARWSGERHAERAGLATAICVGPGLRHGTCPVLEGRRCPLVDGADAIVIVRDPDDATTHELIRAHHELRPTTPVFVRVTDGLPADLAEFVTPAAESDAGTVERIADATRPGADSLDQDPTEPT